MTIKTMIRYFNKWKITKQANLESSMTPEMLGSESSNISMHGVTQYETELSHDKTRPINVLDLPLDILHIIFDYLQDDRIPVLNKAKWRVQWRNGRPTDKTNKRRQTIQSTRLVCRLFHQLASPLLCPTLQVKLDQASLDLVYSISRSPLIAAGVRGIQVVLDYYPRGLAADLSRFKDQRKKDLYQVYSACDFYTETSYLSGYDDSVCPLPLRKYHKAMDYYRSICLAWDKCFTPVDGNAKDANSLEHQRVLRQSHEEYRQKHEEQLRLMTDGSFVNILASSMSQMAHCSSLRFVDKIDCYFHPYLNNPTLLVNNTEELFRFMTAPRDWRTIEETEGAVELLPAKILSELPIAIYKAGTKLREIHISCFPLKSNYSMICPDRQDRLNPSWADLRAACQHLEVFEFGGGSLNISPVRQNHLLAEEQTAIDKYLSAILSGQNLEVVFLNCHAFKLTDDRFGFARGSYRIGSVLGATNWPRLKRAFISNVSLDQGELEKFYNRLGHRWEMFSLYSVQLLSGSWAGTLDILRKNILSRCLDMKCEVHFKKLTGGEFGKGKKRKIDPFSLPTDSDMEEPLIVTLSQKYVLGIDVAKNPLKGGLVRAPKKSRLRS